MEMRGVLLKNFTEQCTKFGALLPKNRRAEEAGLEAQPP